MGLIGWSSLLSSSPFSLSSLSSPYALCAMGKPGLGACPIQLHAGEGGRHAVGSSRRGGCLESSGPCTWIDCIKGVIFVLI